MEAAARSATDPVPIFPHGRATDAGLSKVMVNLTALSKG
jgi:hypothetical protein